MINGDQVAPEHTRDRRNKIVIRTPKRQYGSTLLLALETMVACKTLHSSTSHDYFILIKKELKQLAWLLLMHTQFHCGLGCMIRC